MFVYLFCIQVSLESKFVLLPRNKHRSFFSSSTDYCFIYLTFLVPIDVTQKFKYHIRLQNMLSDNINSNKKASDSL